jgi:hypothetical protein
MKHTRSYMVALGIGIGVAIGVATHQIAVWIAIGAAIGISLASSVGHKKCCSGSEPDKFGPQDPKQQ